MRSPKVYEKPLRASSVVRDSWTLRSRIAEILANPGAYSEDRARAVYHILTALRGPDNSAEVQQEAKTRYTLILRTVALGYAEDVAWPAHTPRYDTSYFTRTMWRALYKGLQEAMPDSEASRTVDTVGYNHWWEHMRLAWQAVAELYGWSLYPSQDDLAREAEEEAPTK